jgi:hypothetical protein
VNARIISSEPTKRGRHLIAMPLSRGISMPRKLVSRGVVFSATPPVMEFVKAFGNSKERAC